MTGFETAIYDAMIERPLIQRADKIEDGQPRLEPIPRRQGGPGARNERPRRQGRPGRGRSAARALRPFPGPARMSVAPSILVVLGVSGAGKTTIASMLAKRLDWQFEDADWFHPPENVAKMSAGTPLTDADRWPWLAKIHEWIEAAHARGEHAIIACSALRRAYREVLVGDLGLAVRMVYLEGSRELIESRLNLRHGHFMPATLLDSQFATLEVPGADENPITVSIAPHPREIVTNIIAAIETEIGGPVPEGP